MLLKVIKTGSKGNCYVLQSENGSLIIEAGVHPKEVKKALNFNLKNANCIVSHAHGDHSNHIKGFLESGIRVYASRFTHEVKGTHHHFRASFLVENKTVRIGEFKVLPFEVEHDVPCFGFLIEHKECGKVLFLTDTSYCEYTFNGLNNIIIEANHSQEIMEETGVMSFLKDRVVLSHMNINTCKELLQANDLSMVSNIVLIHLSDSNSNSEEFRNQIERSTGVNTIVAENGMVINFNKHSV